MTTDEQHLRLLTIFHYVVAGVTGLFSLFPVLHLLIGIAILSGVFGTRGQATLPDSFGWAFVLFASTFIAVGLTLAGLIASAGRALQRRRHHTYCVVVAGLECLLMPYGTVLGVFTILVLMRESVKGLFPHGARRSTQRTTGPAEMRMPVRLESVQPVLMSRDVSASIEFYERLGFVRAFGGSPDDPHYAGVRRDGVELHLQWHDAAEWERPGDRPTYRFVVREVDELHREIRDSGIVMELKPAGNTAWGTREFHLRDPDGNGLQFYRDL